MLKTQQISQHSGFVANILASSPVKSRKNQSSSDKSNVNLVKPAADSQSVGQQFRGDIENQTSSELVEAAGSQRRRRRHLSSLQADTTSNSVHDSPSDQKLIHRGQHLDENLAENRDELTERNSPVKPDTSTLAQSDHSKAPEEFSADLVWLNIFLFVILHSSLPIGVYMIYTQRPWATLLFSVLGMYASGLGVTGGSHRLWSHKSYKARWPVQLILVGLQTMAGQNSIYTWSRDHRVHHKFAETNADPHNIKRGFFFAHMGWLCCRKHPDVKEKGKLIDMSDLEANPFVMFQHRHFWWMSALFTVLIPTMIPVLLWRERFWTSFVFSFMLRYLITLHGTWLVNSAAHYYGSRPYDVKIEARESPYVIYNGLGEGFHNYHHTFPYDYATSEFGKYLNITTTFIDLCAALGLVHDRRKVDQETILRRRNRTGDLNEQQQQHQQQSTGCRMHKSIDEEDESGTNLGQAEQLGRQLAPLSNIIHELPYISGLTSMKFTM